MKYEVKHFDLPMQCQLFLSAVQPIAYLALQLSQVTLQLKDLEYVLTACLGDTNFTVLSHINVGLVRYSKVAHIRGFFSSYLRFLCPQCIGSF